MCIETTLICIETTCIETTLYRNDRIETTVKQLLSFSRVGAKVLNGIPSELRKLRKAPSKHKPTHLLQKILETEEMNVDMRYIDLSSSPAFSLLVKNPLDYFQVNLIQVYLAQF